MVTVVGSVCVCGAGDTPGDSPGRISLATALFLYKMYEPASGNGVIHGPDLGITQVGFQYFRLGNQLIVAGRRPAHNKGSHDRHHNQYRDHLDHGEAMLIDVGFTGSFHGSKGVCFLP
jgi:hypothetical protein